MEKTDVVQDVDLEAAARRGVQRLKKGPVAVAGRYDQQAGRVVIELDSGLEIAFRPQHAQGLYFPAIDADLYLPALFKDLLGYKTRLPTPGQNSTGTGSQL
ncbi:hypothetical protein [Malikia spinosa]|uniref:Uncharacterized protein n=1 Tax=Malikia spinosa TaxID=86180 RepID=A0A7C9J8E4_9BURK|nr:hypothetical protein [Malikia spinosa]MYZ52370.1 hypothetical protein [Malikia spinosa]